MTVASLGFVAGDGCPTPDGENTTKVLYIQCWNLFKQKYLEQDRTGVQGPLFVMPYGIPFTFMTRGFFLGGIPFNP